MSAFRKSLVVGLLLVLGFISSTSSLRAQVWARLVVENATTVEVVPADKLPRYGTFWSVQRSNCPPLPFYAPFLRDLNAPVYVLDARQSIFLVDDSTVDYPAIYKEREAERVLRRLDWEAGMLSDEEYWALEGGNPALTMTMSSLASSFAYGNPVYLVDMAATNAGAQAVTASFSIAGGTNNVPYDILTSTSAATPVADWQWLGIGYTSNRYTFSNQPMDQAFYILAKPQKTMVVGWGNSDYGQSDVPAGITNAVMVAGGHDHTLALLNDGTVIAWGRNDFGQSNVPPNLVGVSMIGAGKYHNVALLTNGTVTAWGWNIPALGYTMTNVPPDLTNATVISAQMLHSLALRSNGTVVAWGYNGSGETNVPAGLTDVTAIAAGGQHNLVVKADGTVVAWGWNPYGQCDVPAGLSNVWDVAAGWGHSVALKRDGTVVAWGDNRYGQTDVPGDLSNVVAIAAGADESVNGSGYTLALKSDGKVVAWGQSEVNTPMAGLSNVIAMAGGRHHGLAIRSGPRTPVLTLLPTDQYQIAGGAVTFTSRGAGLYGVSYQWKTNGVNLAGATNATLTLTNVQAAQAVDYTVTVSNEVGTITSPNAHLYLVTPPVITSMTLPTNRVCIYGNVLSFSITASAPGQFNGFPLSYQWAWNGTNLSSATNSAYSLIANDNSSGIYSVTVANAAGSTNAAWQVTVTNVIDVTKDLLLIYNTASTNSIVVKNYYLDHRPMVGGANVLGITCTSEERISDEGFMNQFAPQVDSWLATNATKRPQYIILFPDIPSRIWTVSNDVFRLPVCSVSYALSTNFPDYRPFITSINMGLTDPTNDCIAYINKLERFGTNYSHGQLLISAASGGYGNTNYVLDNIRHGYGYVVGTFSNGYAANGAVISSVTSALLTVGVQTGSIHYFDGLENLTNGVPYNLTHPTGFANLSGYICWGVHSSLGNHYPTNGSVVWPQTSGWWILETLESFNGWHGQEHGNLTQWFSQSAFGGTNYENTPIGAVSNTDEPLLVGVNNPSLYFGLWASGKNFAICAWNSRNIGPYIPNHFQAVGDPFIKR